MQSIFDRASSYLLKILTVVLGLDYRKIDLNRQNYLNDLVVTLYYMWLIVTRCLLIRESLFTIEIRLLELVNAIHLLGSQSIHALVALEGSFSFRICLANVKKSAASCRKQIYIY